MIEKREELRAAVVKGMEARVTVWNARLDLAIKVNDAKLIDQLLAHSPVADGSGCDCGCGGAQIPISSLPGEK
jgi:hypothetical protein